MLGSPIALHAEFVQNTCFLVEELLLRMNLYVRESAERVIFARVTLSASGMAYIPKYR